MVKDKIKKILEKIAKEWCQSHNFGWPEDLKIEVDICPKEIFGDYSSNIALSLGQKFKTDPLEIANYFVDRVRAEKTEVLFEKIEAAKTGFINFFISQKALAEFLAEILRQKHSFGCPENKRKGRVQIEFISANPTGPLTLGNGRGGFYGDVLARILEKAGYKVEREYYINDAGEQIKSLGHSIIGDSEAVYKGDYIMELREKVKEKEARKAGEEGAKIILAEMIKPVIKKVGIKFDHWFSEKSLYRNKEIQKLLEKLEEKGIVYKKDGALWLKTAQFGDDKDRVLIKKNGESTYFLSDIAYLNNKFQRGFDFLICILGADHYGHTKKMEAAAKALGYDIKKVHFIIFQLVHLIEKGREIKMSKRKGVYVTLDELIDKVGVDVARFFFLARDAGSHLNFDLDLAQQKSEKNPVYYIQYAYVRAVSILNKATVSIDNSEINFDKADLSLLSALPEKRLIKKLIRLPEIVEDIADNLQVQRITKYAFELAESFHRFYTKNQVLVEDKNLAAARIALVMATKIVLKNVLDLMGISAPEKM